LEFTPCHCLDTGACLADVSLAAALVGVGLIAARRARLNTHLAQGPFLYSGTLLAVVLLY